MAEMTVFEVHDKLDTALTDWCLDVANSIGSPLVFGHICLGSLSEDGGDAGGGARMTRVVRSGPKGSTTRDESLEQLFRGHINRFGRSATVLDWLTRWFYDRAENAKESEQDSVAEFQFVRMPNDSSEQLKVVGESLQLPSDFVKVLLPDSTATAYLKEAERPHSGSSQLDTDTLDYLTKQLIGARYSAQQIAATSQDVLKLLEVYKKDTDPLRLWTFLGALQTAFLQMKAANLDNEAGFVSVGKVFGDLSKNIKSRPLVVLSAMVSNLNSKKIKTAVKKIEDIVANKPQGFLTGAARVATQSLTNAGQFPRTSRLNRVDLKKNVEGACASREKPWFAEWETLLVTWLAIAIEHLRGSKHEGKALPFTFVAGDWSAIADCGLFEVLELDFKGGRSFFPFGIAQSDITKADFPGTLKRELGRKNYSWFAEGKYALAWDVTWPSEHPRALIRIKDSSWEVALSSLRSGRVSQATRIARWIAFLSADGAGGLLHNGQTIGLFRRDGDWMMQSPNFEKDLTKDVTDALGRAGFSDDLTEKVLGRLLPTLLTLSDDPHAGALLVVVKKGSTPEFESMGAPWHTAQSGNLLSMSSDELAALMAMDGATCLSNESDKARISFRSLVSVPANPKRALSEEARKILDGEGSRKWSSANAARRDEVALVLSVSQDGPIHVYTPTSKKGKEVVDVRPLRPS